MHTPEQATIVVRELGIKRWLNARAPMPIFTWPAKPRYNSSCSNSRNGKPQARAFSVLGGKAFELKRTPNFSDAAAISIGTIIDAGILVVLGVALGYAGTAAVVSKVIVGTVALFSASKFLSVSGRKKY